MSFESFRGRSKAYDVETCERSARTCAHALGLGGVSDRPDSVQRLARCSVHHAVHGGADRLGFHFLGNILSGRFKKKFIQWQGWPHHEGPPIPTLPKFLHFQHMMAMILLAISGLYIRFPGFIPLWSNGRTFMRWVHYVAMIVVTINLIWRLWYAFCVIKARLQEFAITKQDIVTAPQVILYYIFVKKSKPHLGKYNVMQKATYIVFVPLLSSRRSPVSRWSQRR